MVSQASATRAATLRTGFAASVLLHLLALAALLALIRARPLPLPTETSVDVQIVLPSDMPVQPTPPSSEPVQPPQRTTEPPAPVQPTPFSPVPENAPAERAPEEHPPLAIIPEPPPPAANPGRIRATEMLSGKMLADPRSRAALRQLRQLAAPDQIEQLCNLEAMQQVHHWKADFAPEFVVAYAASDPIRSARAIEAHGAAFLSRAHWYAIDFRCTVSDDLQAVASFDFQVGREIPEDKWDEYSLFASSKEQD